MKTAPRRKTIAVTSRRSWEGGAGSGVDAGLGLLGAAFRLAFALGTELRDLAVLVDRDNGIFIHGRADE